MLFVKQKTAYEMRISDWSSGVCSSDLAFHHAVEQVLARDLSPLFSTHQDRIGAQVRSISLIINGRTLAASHMRAVRHFADHDIDVDLRAEPDDERHVDFPAHDLFRKNLNHYTYSLTTKPINTKKIGMSTSG